MPSYAQLSPSPELAFGPMQPLGLAVAFAASHSSPARSNVDLDRGAFGIFAAEADSFNNRSCQIQGLPQESPQAHG